MASAFIAPGSLLQYLGTLIAFKVNGERQRKPGSIF